VAPTTDLSAAARPVDLAAVSFRGAAGTAVTHRERELEGVVSFGWGRAVIIKALGCDPGTNSLRDEFGDVDDSLALVDTCFHVITHSHWRGRSRRRAVDPHMSATTRRGSIRAGLGDPHGLQPLVDAY
jgi:hypothetical protein